MKSTNVLVATDFSNDAYNALFYATKIFSSQQCIFHIVNIYDDLTDSSTTRKFLFIGEKELTQLRKNSHDNLAATVHRINLDTNNKLHTFKTISAKGSISSVISQTIDNISIDLIIVGNKGKTGARELFMGSNTIHIANTIINCPILAIPKEIAYTPIAEIAFVTDFKKGCTRNTVAMLLAIAAITQAAIRVLHIKESEIMTHNQVSNKKLLGLCLSKTAHSFEDVLNYGDKVDVIQDFLSSREINILAMAYHRRNFFERLVTEPVIMDLSIYATVPFLILPIQD